MNDTGFYVLTSIFSVVLLSLGGVYYRITRAPSASSGISPLPLEKGDIIPPANAGVSQPPPAAQPSPAAAEPALPPPVEPVRPTLRVYWGSQTGTASDMAKTLVREAVTRHGLKAVAVDLGKFSTRRERGDTSDEAVATRVAAAKAALQEPGVAVFLTATYGEGDPTDNAEAFVKWLSLAAHPGDVLSALRFTVFGLGNKTYERYNRTGKVVNARLEALGGKRVYGFGEGDDDDDIAYDFQVWQEEGLWAALKGALNEVSGGAPVAAVGAGTGGKGGSDGAAGVGGGKEEEASSRAAPSSPTSSSSSNPPTQSDAEEGGPLALDWCLIPVTPPTTASVVEVGAFQVALSQAELLEGGASASPASRHFFEARSLLVTHTRELRPNPTPGTSTRHVELECPPIREAGGTGTGTGSGGGGPMGGYGTCDNCNVCPENPPEIVAALAQRLGYTLNQWFTLEPRRTAASGGVSGGGGGGGSLQHLFPTPTTVKSALACFLDVCAPPRKLRGVLSALAPYASSHSGERRRLEWLGSREGRFDWEALTSSGSGGNAGGGGGHWGLRELLAAFPTLNPPLEALVQIFPVLQPRTYTIASSALAHPTFLSLAVSILPGGLCSSYLARVAGLSATATNSTTNSATATAAGAAAPPRVRVTLRPSTFKLPQDAKAPLLLVGPGTGVAPMRAFLQERGALAAAAAAAAATGGVESSSSRGAGASALEGGGMGSPFLGEAILFFGCRNRGEDYLYEEELSGAARGGALTGLHTAFSREGASKVYVQHVIEERGEEVWQLLSKEDVRVFVCGATAMGVDVMAAFQRVAEKYGKKDGVAYIRSLQAKGQYIQELWSSG